MVRIKIAALFKQELQFFAYLIPDSGLFLRDCVLQDVSTSVLGPEARVNVCAIPLHHHLAAWATLDQRAIRKHTPLLQTYLFPQQQEMRQECKSEMRGANGSRRVTCEVRHVVRSRQSHTCPFIQSDTHTQEPALSALCSSITPDPDRSTFTPICI